MSHLKKDELMSLDAIILGAGPAGLAVAHELAKGGAKVKVVESSQRVGGSIRTINQEGWIVETGPNTLQINGESDLKILQGYGLDKEILHADSNAANRYILSRGKLHALTAQPTSLLKSDLLSFTEKSAYSPKCLLLAAISRTSRFLILSRDDLVQLQPSYSWIQSLRAPMRVILVS